MTNHHIFPLQISPQLPSSYGDRWKRFFVQASDRNRMQEEGIWRRTQTSANASESGWMRDSDQRRRIVYYLHDFGFEAGPKCSALTMIRSYIYYSLSLPQRELQLQKQRICKALLSGGWQRFNSLPNRQEWQLGDLSTVLEAFETHPEDHRANRELPSDYRSLDVTIRTSRVGAIQPRLPWQVLEQGMRTKDSRGNPAIVADLAPLVDLLPCHIELGCGVSIEAGVPALHHLHDMYCVTDRSTDQFHFGGAGDDLIPRLLSRPTAEYARLGALFAASFVAEPTSAHRALLALRERGLIVGPVMTNNFDGLAHRAGLPEHFLRRYDQSVPPVTFDPSAKALLVIGSHADRRRVQQRARARGMRVLYLDPEGYTVDNCFVPYPLEGPMNEDMLCRTGATEGLKTFCARLGVPL